jgi:hypothetical protein
MAKPRKRRTSSKRIPIPIWIIGLVGFVLVAAGLVLLNERPGSDPTLSTLPYPEVTRISPAEAHEQQQAGTGVIIDVRGAQFYQASHAAGAVSIPEDDLVAQMEELPTDKTLIFYCT